jgi:hypothetical protein
MGLEVEAGGLMRTVTWLALAAVLACGCGTGMRDVTGRLDTSSAPLGSVVLAQTSDGAVFASSISLPGGGFRLTVPTGQRLRLAVAQPTSDGFLIVTRIMFRSASGLHLFATFDDDGRLVRLGLISAAGTAGDAALEDQDDHDRSDDDADGEVCESGHHLGDDGGMDGHHCDGGVDINQGNCDEAPADHVAEGSGDVERDGDIHVDDGHPGDDEGDALHCHGRDGGR